jgi:hypothetical protein
MLGIICFLRATPKLGVERHVLDHRMSAAWLNSPSIGTIGSAARRSPAFAIGHTLSAHLSGFQTSRYSLPNTSKRTIKSLQILRRHREKTMLLEGLATSRDIKGHQRGSTIPFSP